MSAIRTARSLREGSRNREEGSAYVLTLMILLVLTVVGLSLTLVTQTEVLVGDQERVIQRVFYAAEGGLNLGLSNTLNYNLNQVEYEMRSEFDVSGSSGKLNVADQVQVTGFVPVGSAVCPLCEENVGQERFKSILFTATSQATRNLVDMSGDDDVPLARKAMTYMVQTYPTDERFLQPYLQRDEKRNKLIRM
ncbi:MAG: hypothetical protein DWQ36_12720 [Acidobacteria bacterium]|nr:MAG: hypothetical protein DWQ30_08820 [Acidobacteriota bacterium]REK07192.1 MAG: hypothetical protein DWQ36_12720 [Acidobacteriota bacterium]